MNKLLLVLLLASPSFSQSLDLGKGYSLALPTLGQIETANVLALRDYYNGQWLAGYGHEWLYLMRGGDEIAYSDAWNAFNTSDGKGVFGISAGVHPCAAVLHGINTVTNSGTLPSEVMPPWLKKSNTWESIEVGAGDRPFGGGGPGVKNFAATIGFELSVTFGTIFGVTGSL